jgi:hypothetical protein
MVALVVRLIVCACANELPAAHTQTYAANAPRMEIGLRKLLAQRGFTRLAKDHSNITRTTRTRLSHGRKVAANIQLIGPDMSDAVNVCERL